MITEVCIFIDVTFIHYISLLQTCHDNWTMLFMRVNGSRRHLDTKTDIT